MTEIRMKQFEYAIKHTPVRYFVTGWFLNWRIVTMDGSPCGFYFTKSMADVQCQLLNSAYSLGYTLGQTSVLNIIKDDL